MGCVEQTGERWEWVDVGERVAKGRSYSQDMSRRLREVYTPGMAPHFYEVSTPRRKGRLGGGWNDTRGAGLEVAHRTLRPLIVA